METSWRTQSSHGKSRSGSAVFIKRGSSYSCQSNSPRGGRKTRPHLQPRTRHPARHSCRECDSSGRHGPRTELKVVRNRFLILNDVSVTLILFLVFHWCCHNKGGPGGLNDGARKAVETNV